MFRSVALHIIRHGGDVNIYADCSAAHACHLDSHAFGLPASPVETYTKVVEFPVDGWAARGQLCILMGADARAAQLRRIAGPYSGFWV